MLCLWIRTRCMSATTHVMHQHALTPDHRCQQAAKHSCSSYKLHKPTMRGPGGMMRGQKGRFHLPLERRQASSHGVGAA